MTRPVDTPRAPPLALEPPPAPARGRRRARRRATSTLPLGENVVRRTLAEAFDLSVMTELVDLLTSLMPDAARHIPAGKENNPYAMTEPEVRAFLDAVLGDAPRPEWGLRGRGWPAYVAELLSWKVGRSVTEAEARACFRRV